MWLWVEFWTGECVGEPWLCAPEPWLCAPTCTGWGIGDLGNHHMRACPSGSELVPAV